MNISSYENLVTKNVNFHKQYRTTSLESLKNSYKNILELFNKDFLQF